MKIAIAGGGDVGRYFLEEFCKSQHKIVLLTTRAKDLPGLKFEQRITDYSVDDLTEQLSDCNAVVSTISGEDDVYISTHTALLEACRRSDTCKRLIPSEWSINIEDFPDQPKYIVGSRSVFRERLRAEREVEWTLVCNGWFMEYLLPPSRRYLKDYGRAWVTDNEKKLFDIYGDGLQEVSLTSVRDVAAVCVALVEQPFGSWSEYTHFASQTMTYWDLFHRLKDRDPGWQVRNVTLTEVISSLLGEDPKFAGVELLMIMGFTRANKIRQDKALEWGQEALAGIEPYTVDRFLDKFAG